VRAPTGGASTGQPSGAVIVALPAAGDPVHPAATDPHVTLHYLGEATDLTPAERAGLVNLTARVAASTPAFDADVSGIGTLGEDDQPVLLLQAHPLTRLYDQLAAEPLVERISERTDGFPSWIPHLSIRDQADAAELEEIRVGALGLWIGEEHQAFPLAPTQPDPEKPHRRALAAAAVSSFSCPAITDARSFQVGARYANAHPEARPFVVKAAARLGLLNELPAWPERIGVVVNVNRTSAVVTAAGLVDQRTGQPFGGPPSSRRVRREIRDRADLLARINAAPTDPAERRALVQAAMRLDRVRYIPADWPEKPTEAYPLRPGAAEMIQRAAYGRTSAEADQVARERVRGTR